MRILTSGQQLPPSGCVALGALDGIHPGHRMLIEQTVGFARARGVPSCVFTFDRLPSGAKRILSVTQRNRILEELGVDVLYVQTFDQAFRSMMPDGFLQQYFHSAMLLAAGFNFRFGKNRTGTIETLRAFGAAQGIEVFVLDGVLIGDVPVSSTGIRRAVERGELEEARRLLGRGISIDGTVIHGDHMGRGLGFPTANLPLQADRLTPPNGVYATIADLDGRKFPSFTNIGGKPTIVSGRHLAETHLFDFDGDLYGRYMQVEFIQRLRDVRTFPDVDALTTQLRQDKRTCLEIFSKNGLQMRNNVL